MEAKVSDHLALVVKAEMCVLGTELGSLEDQ